MLGLVKLSATVAWAVGTGVVCLLGGYAAKSCIGVSGDKAGGEKGTDTDGERTPEVNSKT